MQFLGCKFGLKGSTYTRENTVINIHNREGRFVVLCEQKRTVLQLKLIESTWRIVHWPSIHILLEEAISWTHWEDGIGPGIEISFYYICLRGWVSSISTTTLNLLFVTAFDNVTVC